MEHPFDLTKVRLQSQPLDRPARYTGPWDCIVQTYRAEGVRAFWRVSLPHCLTLGLPPVQSGN